MIFLVKISIYNKIILYKKIDYGIYEKKRQKY